MKNHAVIQIVFTFGGYEKLIQDLNFEDRTELGGITFSSKVIDPTRILSYLVEREMKWEV